jgi:hypothetical protein
LDAHGITELIATLAARQASGRLEIVAGGNEGALLFRSGKLVDARIGHLTGFQAINALASMRDARFHFDPAVAVPAVSSITPRERLVLKQFFGIETADSHDQPAPAPVEEVNETTVIRSTVPSEVIDEPTDVAATYARPRVRYVAVLALAVLLIAVVTAAVLLREKFRERNSQVTVATKTEEVSPSAAAPPAVNETPRATTPDLTGEWTVVNTVDTTSYRSFQNLRIGFELSINQTGTTFTATGQKVSENGRSLPENSRTPIELHGVINGDRIEATFNEQGPMRKTNGRFVWKIDRQDGGLKGRFASTAARTSGKSTATREL